MKGGIRGRGAGVGMGCAVEGERRSGSDVLRVVKAKVEFLIKHL